MSKSLRSKWKRKMRAVKRERYGEKELKRLNDMLAKAGDCQFATEIKTEDGSVAPEQEMIIDNDVTITSQNNAPVAVAKYISTSGRKSRIDHRKDGARKPRKQSEAENDDGTQNVEKMSVDGDRVFSKKTMRDQYGNYPEWMNKRKMRTQQKKNKRLKKRALSVKKKVY